MITIVDEGKEYPNFTSLDIAKVEETGPVYLFKNLQINKNDNKPLILNGNWMIIGKVPYYGHFLQEIIGSALLYKQKHPLHILWVDNELGSTADGHEMESKFNLIKNKLRSDQDLELNYHDFSNTNIVFENLITFFYSSRFIPNSNEIFYHFNFKDTYMHGMFNINKELRNFFSNYMVKDNSFPKKIFISRKKRSVLIEEFKEESIHFSRYSPIWYHDEIENFYKKMGYEVIEFSNIELDKQIKYFYNAELIAGINGAGFLNGIFCDSDVRFDIINSHREYVFWWERDIKSVIQAHFNYIDLYDWQKDLINNELNNFYDKINLGDVN
jgi:hypothetical protein